MSKECINESAEINEREGIIYVLQMLSVNGHG